MQPESPRWGNLARAILFNMDLQQTINAYNSANAVPNVSWEGWLREQQEAEKNKMEAITEYVITAPGKLKKRIVSEFDLQIPDSMITSLQQASSFRVRNVFDIPEWGKVNAIITGGRFSYWTVPVKRIILRTAYELVRDDKEGDLYLPNFKSKDNAEELIWEVPNYMRMIILMTMRTEPTGPEMRYSVQKSYLYAVDSKPEYWKVPLCNLFEDCAVCEGREIKTHATMLQAITDMLSIFDRSRWGSDLVPTRERTIAIFRWSPKDKGFKQLPCIHDNWTRACTKVVVAEIQKWIHL